MNRIDDYIHRLGGLLFLGTLTSCATLFKGTKADITLTGPTDEPVTLITSRDTFQHQQLPATIKVKKSDLEKPIKVESENYRFSRIVPGRKTDWWSVAQALGPFGLTGLVIDGVTGAVNLPKQNTYAIDYVAKTDTVTSLAPEVIPTIYNLKKKEPRKFMHHELRLALGLGNADEKACDQLFDELDDQYHLKGTTLIGRFHRSLSGSYYYHLNRFWAVGVTFGWNQWKREMSNWEYCDSLHSAWKYLSDYWLRKGDAGNALFYRELRLPFNDGDMTHQTLYAMPAVQYTWKHEATEVYSALALGIAYRHLCFKGNIDGKPLSIDRSKWTLGAQVTFLGVRWGKDHFGGIFELGAGHQGYVIGGLSYRF